MLKLRRLLFHICGGSSGGISEIANASLNISSVFCLRARPLADPTLTEAHLTDRDEKIEYLKDQRGPPLASCIVLTYTNCRRVIEQNYSCIILFRVHPAVRGLGAHLLKTMIYYGEKSGKEEVRVRRGMTRGLCMTV